MSDNDRYLTNPDPHMGYSIRRMTDEVAALRAELASAEAECRDHAHRATAAEAERDAMRAVVEAAMAMADDPVGPMGPRYATLTDAVDAYREATRG